jgi:transglutaminase-like putative cysteine protease
MENTRFAETFAAYLRPTFFIDSDSPEVIEFARSTIGDAQTDVEKGVKLYYAVRDLALYRPYDIIFEPQTFKASTVLAEKVSFCIPKAILLAAGARAVGLPSRLGFADVRNHLSTGRLLDILQTDVFVYHGYTELYLDGRWVKSTPAFNLSLCQKFGVLPLEFDGLHDSIFHPFDRQGQRHMEYLHDHGHFADLDFEHMMRAFSEAYPHLFGPTGSGWPRGDFERELNHNATAR